MKTTKILTLTLLMSIFCVASSNAQKEQKPKASKERTENRMEMMKKSLDLTDEQVAKLESVRKKMSEDMKQSQDKDKANREEMKVKMAAYDAQVKTILTPEQYQKYQEQKGKRMQKDSRAKLQKGRKGEFQKSKGKKK